MSDPDRFAWRDPDLAADLAAEAETVGPPPGARDRVLEGILMAASAGAVAGLSGTAAAAGLEAAGTGAAAAGSTAAAGTVAGGAAGGAALTGAATTGALATGTAAAAGGGLVAKGLLAAALVGGGATVTWQATRPDTPPAPAADQAATLAQPDVDPRAPSPRRGSASGAPAPVAPLDDVPPPPRSLPSTLATEAATPPPTPPVAVRSAAPSPMALIVPLKTKAAPNVRPTRPARRPAKTARRTPPTVVDAALRSETQMMHAARRALRAGRWAEARRVLDLHARRFPGGTHTEEREALRVLRLQRMGAPTATEALDAFAQRFGQSLYLGMLGR